MANDSLFLGIDSSGGIVSAVEFILRRNRFLQDGKSIPVSIIEVALAMGWGISIFHHQFLLGSFLIPTQFPAPWPHLK